MRKSNADMEDHMSWTVMTMKIKGKKMIRFKKEKHQTKRKLLCQQMTVLKFW